MEVFIGVSFVGQTAYHTDSELKTVVKYTASWHTPLLWKMKTRTFSSQISPKQSK